MMRVRMERNMEANVCFSLLSPTETVKQIIINIEAGVEVEVTIAA